MNKSMHQILMTAALYSIVVVIGQQNAMADSYPTKDAVDNTKMNQGDQNVGAVTADHAKQNVSDRELMSQIRKSVMRDRDLSTYAHNIKIVAQNGIVTLKGPVKTSDEKKTVLSEAVVVAGADNVKDQITVKEKSN